MNESNEPSPLFFQIGELHSAPYPDMFGYTGYRKGDGRAFAEQASEFINASAGNDVSDRPTRVGQHGAEFDSPLSVVAEDGCNRYAFVIQKGSGLAFGSPAIVEVPIGGKFSGSHIKDIKSEEIDGQDIVSFVFDTDAVKNSDLAKVVRDTAKYSALKIPFYLNLLDAQREIPAWLIDGLRDGHTAIGATGVSAASTIFTHGGIHPPGIASFVILTP